MKKIVIFLIVGTLLVSCRHSGRHNDSQNSAYRNNQTEYANNEPSERQSKTHSKTEPDEETIKRNLVGKEIIEPTKQLYRSKFYISSAKNVLSVEITNKENNGDEILYSADLLLTDDVNKYKAEVNITYSNSGKGWQIQYIESKSLDIVPTGKFDNCISVGKEAAGMFIEHLFLYNKCDVALIVEGSIFAWTRGSGKREWQYFADEVPANGKKDFYYEINADYKITRIERP